ncbi:hypothetical protein GCWU000322_00824 [Eubacterium saphenum ATCC 49989]|nr:hypothetical protein GCWU000322_00824 [Eubacterium saphenum ATCC 49989]
MEERKYLLGTEEQQAWMKDYFFAPRGIGFAEPGTVAVDSTEFSAYNVAKSFYQNYPEVFNLGYIASKVKVDKEEVRKRLKRMYDERIIMLVYNPAVAVYGWGLYYWVVKLKKDTPKEIKQQLAEWFQSKDDICTGYEAEGDFDFFNGNHMRVLDNLLSDVIGPWRDMPELEYVHLCPIRRDVRESNVNMWDAHGDGYRKFVWGKEQVKKLLKVQDKIDAVDFGIIDAINNTKTVGDMFDYAVLEDLSGLSGEQMKKDFVQICDVGRYAVPMIYLNHMKLGLTMKMYLVRMFQNVPSYRKSQITDELSDMPEFNNIWEFSDSFYDVMLSSFEELTDWKDLRSKIESYGEVEEVKIANSPKQFRRWVCRLDDQNGYWEECVFTDDFLQDRTVNNDVKCRFSVNKEVK